MKDIPHDIWLHIAEYIPARVLRNLFALNRSFFDIAMDCRYRQMSFVYPGDRMIRNLVRLKDPFVARRVRILHIHPGFLKDALDKQDASSSHRTLRDRFTDMANLIREQSIFPKNQKYKMERRCRRPEDVVQVMLEVLGGLPNVTDYFVTWCGMPTVGTVSAVGFLSTVFSANLRKLSLEISVENVHSLLSSPHDMRNLEELRLAIQRDVTCSKSRHAEILARDLAPAIGGLRKTLQTLVIQPWEPIDLSPLFLALPYLSELHTLILFVPVEGQHLGDPLGLAALLTRHAPSLRTLRLRATQNSGPGLTPNLESFHEWFTQVLSRTHLTRLRTLDVSSPLFPVETTLVAVRHFARTITSLSLTGKFWAYEDVEEVVRVVSQCNREDSLGKLCLGPTSLSPQLLELLFLNLPQLFRVELFVCGLLPHASESVLYDDGSQNIEQIDDFLSEMDTRIFPFSQLRFLSMLYVNLPYRSYYSHVIERLLTTSIPSVKSYRC